MERKSFSQSSYEQIVNLKELIAQITDESQQEINALKQKIAEYENNPITISPNSPTKNEKALLKELAKLRRVNKEENTKINTEAQKEISSLQFQIAELKNVIAQQDANNAQLTLENLSLKTKIHKLNDELSDKHVEILNYRHSFEEGASQLIQSQMKSHREIIHRLSQAQKEQSKMLEKSEKLMRELKLAREIAAHNETAVHYLANALTTISDMPQSNIPTAADLIDNPDALIDFVKEVETIIRHERNSLQKEIHETTQTLSNTLVKAQQPPLSRPVARVLTNLGAVILDVTEQMNEEHKQTMKLLESTNEIDTNLFDDSFI
ncbi:hypothetical protein TRFO_21479 [Tritrichomonas foetus]|uniref:Uncharacterized protein n=1 Tax=Tritrichomonas foetus TaxID=1144522 RepID=A0A1J4KF82_9EUKA|nr:hypothetical protein TRFO_21479 [Tritrichomonas foetus]|eukprot:OHT09592.1 hypothetical protein TRFO_21479 [Tritrichomonas foetus]